MLATDEQMQRSKKSIGLGICLKTDGLNLWLGEGADRFLVANERCLGLASFAPEFC